MKSSSEKYRILLSRVAVVMILFLFLTTRSGWESKSEITTLALFLTGIILVAIASTGRMWCSLYIAGYKNARLIKDGPYSMSRNPLYFFSLIGVIGIGFATETFSFPIALTLLFASYYGFVIKSEERRLRRIFGVEFDEYARRVPAFFPRLKNFSEPEDYSVRPAVYRRHIFSALWFVWIVGLLETVEGLKEIGILTPYWTLY